MIQKIKQIVLRHKKLSGLTLVLILTLGFFGYRAWRGGGGQTRYVTSVVEKGTLVVSVSGSGQIDASDKIDIKPEVSGNVSALYIKKGQEVKKGQLMAVLDSRDAQRAINDAEIALEDARIKLEELISQPDEQSLLQAENALAQAERDLEKAKENYENIGADTEQTLKNAYEEGYSSVSTIFFKLSDYIKDLQGVLGTSKNEQEYVTSYKRILGDDSLFVKKFVDDYYSANNLYNKNFAFFRQVFRDDSRETIYQLVKDTLETTKAVSKALESSRHMYDAITDGNYTQYGISSIIDKMQPKVESDLSAVFSNISSLQKTIDTIDVTVQDAPDNIKDAGLAFKSAKEKLEEKKLSFEELKAGADPLDIRAQRNAVAQKESALLTAKENLASHSIYTPFTGFVAEANTKVKIGDSVSAGTVLATFITRQKIAQITLNEVDATKVKVGQKAILTFDAVSDLTISGEVAEIDSIGTVSQGVVTYAVKITLDTQSELVKPAMSVSVSIITEVKSNVLLVPNSAVKSQNDAQYVQIVEGENQSSVLAANSSGVILKSSPRQQMIKAGLANDEFTEIVGGLKEGDLVVTQTVASSAASTRPQQNSNFRIPGMTGGATFIR